MKLKIRGINIYEIIILVAICVLVSIYATKSIAWFSTIKWHIFNDSHVKYKNIELKIPLRCWAEEIDERLFVYSIPHKDSKLPFSYISIQKMHISEERLDELIDSVIVEKEVEDSAEYVFQKDIQIGNVYGYCNYYKTQNINENRYYARISIPDKNIYMFIGYMLENDIVFYEDLIRKIHFL